MIDEDARRVVDHEGFDREEIDGAFCPIDPQERVQCDSCQ